jgi:hypothetical protein
MHSNPESRHTEKWSSWIFLRFNQLLILSLIVFVIIVINAEARTPAVYGLPKPENFVIHLPFESGTVSDFCYTSYGDDRFHSKLNKYYSIDFHLFGKEANQKCELKDDTNQQVFPIAKGKVIDVSDHPAKVMDNESHNYGHVIVIEHSEAGFPDYISLYAHLNETNVNEGDNVSPNSGPLGIQGDSGNAGGMATHLHFELRYCKGIRQKFDENPSTVESDIFSEKDLNEAKICQSVVPEPFIGKQVYEGFGWWHKLKPETVAEGGTRPIQMGDTTPPSGWWGENTTTHLETIRFGEAIEFDVRYEDLGSGVGEVRLTAYYKDKDGGWPDPSSLNAIEQYASTFDPWKVWRILLQCNPGLGICGENDVDFSWNPYIDNGLPVVPWLPKAKPAARLDDAIDICISFDVFDKAGNPMYAPGGTHCLIGPNLSEIDQSDRTMGDNYPRMFQILPMADSLPPSDSASYIADITIPDGTVISPGQSLTKTWRMRNTGTTTWGSGYQLVFISGDQMGAPTTVDIPATSPGDEVDISVNLTAPESDGEHKAYWRLRNPDGTYFGPTIWVEIKVQGQTTYPITLTADPTSPANTDSVQFYARVDGFPNFRSMRLKIDGTVVYELGAPEFYYEWNTSGYSSGDHSIIVEVTDQTDTSWDHPEVRGITYTLEGNTNPNNHAPYAPSPTSPYDWHVYYSGNTAQLCAQQNGDPDGDSISEYYFEIYESAQGWNSGWVSNHCVTTSALGPYNYQWRVRVRDGYGAESGWSDSWHFTLVNPNLTITEFYFEPQDSDSEEVRIRACTDGQGGVGITMRVSVNDATDGSENGTWHGIKELGVPCFNEINAPMWGTLEYGDGPHLVRVEAHGSDTSWSGAAVKELVYVLPHRRPAGPNPIAPRPLSGDTREPIFLNSRTITFRWSTRVNASQYTLYVSDVPSPVSDPDPIFQQSFSPTTTEHTVTFDQDFATLYWQVAAINDKGSSTSGDQLFGIDRQPPQCMVETLSDINYESVFQVNWGGTDNLSGVDSVDLQYMDSERGQWNSWLIDSPVTKSYELFTGQTGHTYYFRCRARDQANNLGDYPTNADTSTLIDPSARPSSPWWDAAYDLKRNLIIQNNDNDTLPVHFPVHLRFDANTSPTASEIYTASLATIKGDDVRIVLNDQLELNRYIQRFTSAQIDIWFPLQSSLGSGSIDNSHYQLYYGNVGASNPPANVNMIFLPEADANTIGLWHFQDSPGTTIYDTSGNSNNGVLSNGAWVDGFTGWAGSFNGLNTAVTVPHSSVFNVPAITIEAWMYLTSFNDLPYPIVVKRIPYTPGGFELHMTHDREFTWLIDHYGMNSSYALSLNQWHHIAVTSNGIDQLCAYVDGNQVKCGQGGPLEYNNGPITIGFMSTGDGDYSFPGYIQHVRISNIARTSFPYAKIDVEASVVASNLIEPPSNGSADLVLLDLVSYPNPRGGILVQSEIQNQGNLDTLNGFYTDLYLDHLPTGSGDYTGSVRFWVNDPVGAGSKITLTTELNDFPGILGFSSQNLQAGSEITTTLYAQVDSTGSVTESDDQNNISPSGTQVCLASPDAYESDDTIGSATVLNQGQFQKHNFDKIGDEDWFRFSVQKDEELLIKTDNLAPSSDTYLYLYKSDGTTLLASNDDYGGSLASQIEWTAPASGTYYVLVKHWNPNVGGCGTSYTVSITEKVYGEFRIYLPLTIQK